MKVYLDTNVWCRPFDDLRQERILDEAESLNKLLLMNSAGLLKIITSEAVIAEVSLIEDIEKKEQVESLINSSAIELIQVDDQLIKLADDVKSACKLKDFMDALHIAASLQSCTFLLTCDDELTKNASVFEANLHKLGYSIKIRNPVNFLEEMEVE